MSTQAGGGGDDSPFPWKADTIGSGETYNPGINMGSGVMWLEEENANGGIPGSAALPTCNIPKRSGNRPERGV